MSRKSPLRQISVSWGTGTVRHKRRAICRDVGGWPAVYVYNLVSPFQKDFRHLCGLGSGGGACGGQHAAPSAAEDAPVHCPAQGIGSPGAGLVRVTEGQQQIGGSGPAGILPEHHRQLFPCDGVLGAELSAAQWVLGMLEKVFPASTSFTTAEPTTHSARDLLDTEGVVRTWYVFWVLPAVFVLFNLFQSFQLDGLLYSGRLLSMYALLSLMLTGLLLLFYLLFYLVAWELDVNTQLKQENQFLHMQTAKYEVLRTAIDETRRARHDLRHHFGALSALAEREAWEELRRYLAQAADSVPVDELSLCENPAVDGAAGRYSSLSRQHGVPFGETDVDDIELLFFLPCVP